MTEVEIDIVSTDGDTETTEATMPAAMEPAKMIPLPGGQIDSEATISDASTIVSEAESVEEIQQSGNIEEYESEPDINESNAIQLVPIVQPTVMVKAAKPDKPILDTPVELSPELEQKTIHQEPVAAEDSDNQADKIPSVDLIASIEPSSENLEVISSSASDTESSDSQTKPEDRANSTWTEAEIEILEMSERKSEPTSLENTAEKTADVRPSKLITKIEDQLNLIGEINQATIDQHLEAFSEEPVKILNRSRHLIIART